MANQQSTSAAYQQARPVQFETGNELDGYFQDKKFNQQLADTEATRKLKDLSDRRKQAAKDRDDRKKAAEDIAKFAELDLPDTTAKWQTVVGKLHQKLTTDLIDIKSRRDAAFASGDTEAYQKTFADESAVRSKLDKYKTAHDAFKQAHENLAKGIDDGTYSKKRNAGLMRDIFGMYVGDWDWDEKTEQFIFKNVTGEETRKSVLEMQMNPLIYGRPALAYDWQKWTTDIAGKIGTDFTEYTDPETGETITVKDIKDYGLFEDALGRIIDANPDLLAEYQADENSIDMDDDGLKTKEDLIKMVAQNAKLFGDTISKREPKKEDTNKKKDISESISQSGYSNGIIHTEDGSAVNFSNDTRNSMPLTFTVKGSVSGNVGTASLSYKDKPKVDVEGQADGIQARIYKPQMISVQGFVAQNVAEDLIYNGPKVFVRTLDDGAELPQNYSNTDDYLKEETKNTNGVFLEPGQILPSGLLEKGKSVIFKVDDDDNILNEYLKFGDLQDSSFYQTSVKGVDKNGMSYSVLAGNDNFEFYQAIDGESKGDLKKYMDHLGKDMKGNIVDVEKYAEATGVSIEEAKRTQNKGAIPKVTPQNSNTNVTEEEYNNLKKGDKYWFDGVEYTKK